MENLKVLLGKRIREFRKAKNYTQEELAEKIGIGTNNISYFVGPILIFEMLGIIIFDMFIYNFSSLFTSKIWRCVNCFYLDFTVYLCKKFT